MSLIIIFSIDKHTVYSSVQHAEELVHFTGGSWLLWSLWLTGLNCKGLFSRIVKNSENLLGLDVYFIDWNNL